MCSMYIRTHIYMCLFRACFIYLYTQPYSILKLLYPEASRGNKQPVNRENV